jgi:DNA polymerase
MDALALLRLQMEWGADEALEEAPVDRLRQADAKPAMPRLAMPRPATHRPTPPLAVAAPVAVAATPPAEAATLEALRAAIATFEGCALRATASNLVFADGNPAAGLLVIGEAPGDADDRSGRAFDGAAGAYLDRMLGSVGLDRSKALLTPLIPWRPPGGRPPTAQEIGACLPFLHRLIILTAPRRAILLGTLAQRSILGAAPRRRTGGWLPATVPGRAEPLPALALPSPELLMARPAGRRDAWTALRLLRRSIDDEIAIS